MPREYSQKAALVTGGARGIGAAIARLLAERGYRVAVADWRARTKAERGMLLVRCDVSKEAASPGRPPVRSRDSA